jgi:hypothetical protein
MVVGVLYPLGHTTPRQPCKPLIALTDPHKFG